MVETPTISLHKGKDAQKRAYQTTIIVVETENALDAMGKVIIQIIRMEKRKIIFAQPATELNNVLLVMERDSDKKVVSTKNFFVILFCIICSHINAQEFVDLGLSVNWCTANIGALATNQPGDLFAWGETEPRTGFTMENYKYKDPEYKQWTIDIGTEISGTEYDIATQKNKDWRLPTKKEFLELCEKCKWQWIGKGKNKGYRITGPNGNYIFLPTGGQDTFGKSNKKIGNYWSGTLSNGLGRTAIALHFGKKWYHTEGTYKAYGKMIRPVKTNPKSISSILP